MKLTYDPRHNVAYIRLREQSGQVETIRVSDELNIDLAPDGTIYGIELLERERAATRGRRWPHRRGRRGKRRGARARARGRAPPVTSPAALVNKVWNYAHVLRDDGVSYGDYVEQITCLLFLKMDQERHDHLGEVSRIPAEWRWAALQGQGGRRPRAAVPAHAGGAGARAGPARHDLPQGAEQDPGPGEAAAPGRDDRRRDLDRARRRRQGRDLRGAAGAERPGGQERRRPVLHAAAADRGHGRGRSTRRRARPICDPACGTGGFLLAAYEHMKAKERDREALRRLREETFTGVDIVDDVVRLCAMNLYLHGIGGEREPGASGRCAGLGRREALRPGADQSAVRQEEQLHGGRRGRRHRARAQVYERDDFIATTSNKQLNFLQHIMSILEDRRPRGGGAAGQRAVRGRRRREGPPAAAARSSTSTRCCACRPASSTRQGVKANVLFFDKQAGERDALDQGALDLRLPHQPELHAEAAAAAARGPGRLRRLLPRRATGRRARRASASGASPTTS